MKVVLLGPYPPPHGGVQTNIVAIRKYVRKRGIDCAVINITRHRKSEADDIYYPESALKLIWDLVRKRYDIVHLHVGGSIPLRVTLLALVCASVPWAKSILTLHSGGYPSSEEGKQVKRSSFRAFVFRRFDGLIGVNREIADFFLQVGVRASRVRLIAPHSVAVAKIADKLSEPLASFFAEHDPVLIGVGLLEPEYDLGRQIDALGLIRERFSNAGLVILGSGSLGTKLREQAESKPWAPHILLCGDVPHDMTLRAIAESNVLLRTTLYDGDAVSVREALYLGTPVIATDNGMRPEGVRLISIGDTAALVRAIEEQLMTEASIERKPDTDEVNLTAVLNFYREVSQSSNMSSIQSQ
jgi:glycosyltransferase involved in cell wall biosynthesis